VDAENWQALWCQRGGRARLLYPLSWLYRFLLAWQRQSYLWGLRRIRRAPVPVLVVGNVVVGGTGKTPTVVTLVQHLRQRGWTPGLVSRGHGRTAGPEPHEVQSSDPADAVGDEPALLRRLCQVPMVVDRQRPRAVAHLLRQHPEVDIVVSDDGMQHWSLARDLTVVVFDDRGLGNGWCLPAGLLREPWPAPAWTGSAMLVLQTGRAPAPLPGPYPGFLARRALAPAATNAHGQSRALADWRPSGPRPLAALAGIGTPEGFFALLRAQGLPLAHCQALPDHADGQTLLGALDRQHTWFCTEKDAVKLFPLLRDAGAPDVWAVPLLQHLEPAFLTAIDQALEQLSSRDGRQTA
jgi:tetraacyldisaccharide 4'-kinase